MADDVPFVTGATEPRKPPCFFLFYLEYSLREVPVENGRPLKGLAHGAAELHPHIDIPLVLVTPGLGYDAGVFEKVHQRSASIIFINAMERAPLHPPNGVQKEEILRPVDLVDVNTVTQGSRELPYAILRYQFRAVRAPALIVLDAKLLSVVRWGPILYK